MRPRIDYPHQNPDYAYDQTGQSNDNNSLRPKFKYLDESIETAQFKSDMPSGSRTTKTQ